MESYPQRLPPELKEELERFRHGGNVALLRALLIEISNHRQYKDPAIREILAPFGIRVEGTLVFATIVTDEAIVSLLYYWMQVVSKGPLKCLEIVARYNQVLRLYKSPIRIFCQRELDDPVFVENIFQSL